MIKKPIWCKCKQHSWTRRQLVTAWENSTSVRCPEPTCEREASSDAIEAVLIEQGIIDLEIHDDEGKGG